MMARLWALSLLACALLKTAVTWPLRRSRALEAFRENYAAEGLLPVQPEVHAGLLVAAGCTACGRCDRIVAQSQGRALSQLVRGWMRSLPDAPLAAAEFARYSPSELEQAAALCPTGVPIPLLAQLARRQAARMDAALAPAAAAQDRAG